MLIDYDVWGKTQRSLRGFQIQKNILTIITIITNRDKQCPKELVWEMQRERSCITLGYMLVDSYRRKKIWKTKDKNDFEALGLLKGSDR